jgi:hypothetical protein
MRVIQEFSRPMAGTPSCARPQPAKDGALVRCVAAGFLARWHDPVGWTSQGQGAAAVARHEVAGVIRDAGSAGSLSETNLVFARPLALVRMARGKNGCW